MNTSRYNSTPTISSFTCLCRLHMITMAKPTLSLLIFSFPVLLLLLYSGRSLEVTRAQKTWCVPNPMSNDSELMSNLEFACSQVDCHLIQEDAPCFLPNTHLHHAAFAMNLYYQSRGRRKSSCDFNNSGLVSLTDPSFGNCTFQSGGGLAEETSVGTWCVAKPGASDDLLQQNIDFACNHVDCSPVQEGGSCYIPATLINHASFAMNLYYKTAAGNKSSCDFRRTGLTVTSDPSYGSCFYI